MHFPIPWSDDAADQGWSSVADPQIAGFNQQALAAAVHYAETSEVDWPTDIAQLVAVNDPPPYNRLFGPTKPRGDASGLVIRQGYIAARWGTPERVDVTFSATKSYLSTCVGLAFDRGLVANLDAPVTETVNEGWFVEGAPDHNRTITWRQLLQQTSEWSGTLFDIPDSVDHNRSVARSTAGDPDTDAMAVKGKPRTLKAPGTHWEYNDVRVNVLGRAALSIWRQPLPVVLQRLIMQRIGASPTWQWHAYDNANVLIDGQQMPSVPGGAHWGGGIWINCFDHARFGQLWLNRGNWDGEQLISPGWIDAALAPCQQNPSYGLMWWRNHERALWPDASEQAFAAVGAGGNVVMMEPERDLVVVTRWAGDANGLINRIVAAAVP